MSIDVKVVNEVIKTYFEIAKELEKTMKNQCV